MATKNLLNGRGIEPLENIAQRGVGWRALPVQAEGGIQPLAVGVDKSDDTAIGVRAADHGED